MPAIVEVIRHRTEHYIIGACIRWPDGEIVWVPASVLRLVHPLAQELASYTIPSN